MKYLLIILLAVGLSAKGQNDTLDFGKILGRDTGTTSISSLSSDGTLTIIGSSWFIGDTSVAPRYDTTRIMMLVCDTGFKENVTTMVAYLNIDGKRDTLGYTPNRINNVWWQFGYEVRELYNYYGMSLYTNQPFSQHKEYLDEKKKPLPKSIIVWISKEL